MNVEKVAAEAAEAAMSSVEMNGLPTALRVGSEAMPDFTAHRHPVLAVRCPDCRKATGFWCIRPSGHKASNLHKSRKAEADCAFIAQHGQEASIERTLDGWVIDPLGRAKSKETSE